MLVKKIMKSFFFLKLCYVAYLVQKILLNSR